MVLQLVHTAAVAPYYHVGSFDDDGNYLMAAHVLAAGGGLTTVMPSGARVVALYLPGYPALLVPFIWVLGNGLWVPRAVSVVCTALLYPLLWAWTSRRGLAPWYRVTGLGVLALNPVVATYSSMAMAEAPFLLILVLSLMVIDRLDDQPALAWAIGGAVLLAALIWFKEAGVGLAGGLVLYLAWRRRWAWAGGLAAGVALLLVPGVATRLATGNSMLGDRYASDLSNSVKGGFVRQLVNEVGSNLGNYAWDAFRYTLLPAGGDLPRHGLVHSVALVLGASTPVFLLAGALWWYRRYPRADTWAVGVYLLETLAYPYVNQRRVVLVLPVLVFWYVAGIGCCGRCAWAGLKRVAGPRRAWLLTAAPIGAGVVVAAGLAQVSAQFRWDYMYAQGEQSSEWAHAPAVALLKRLGAPSDVVETDYRGSVAFFTGHRTAWSAFTVTNKQGPFGYASSRCSLRVVAPRLAGDGAKYLFLGDIDNPRVIDSPCLMSLASTPSTAKSLGLVRLLASAHNSESVFERLGPGTSQPALADPVAGHTPPGSSPVKLPPDGQGDVGGTAYRAPARAGRATFTWSWPGPRLVTQVSLGMASSTSAVGAVTVLLRDGAGTSSSWAAVASAGGPVGNGGAKPYLLARLDPPLRASALQVTVVTTGQAEVAYANAVTTSAGRPRPGPARTYVRTDGPGRA